MVHLREKIVLRDFLSLHSLILSIQVFYVSIVLVNHKFENGRVLQEEVRVTHHAFQCCVLLLGASDPIEFIEGLKPNAFLSEKLIFY
jgi:hypothetical protein